MYTAVSAVAPSLLLLCYFHSRDVYREPPRVVWITFLLGIASVFVESSEDRIIRLDK